MPALLPIILTASHVVLAADAVPKFNVEKPAGPPLPRHVAGTRCLDCQRDENDARASSSRIGPSTARPARPVRAILSRSAARPAMLNC